MPSIIIQAAIVGIISLLTTLAHRKLHFIPQSMISTSQNELSATCMPSETSMKEYSIPNNFSAPLSEYPNPLNITPSMRNRSQFHPVIQMVNPTVLDMSQTSGRSQIIPPQDQDNFIQARIEREARADDDDAHYNGDASTSAPYTFGKYDENRANLYSSSLFQNDEHTIDGFDGARTLHVGMDLGGPVGTEVHSFADGVVHSVGYNSELGDYGHVVVVEYDLGSSLLGSNIDRDGDGNGDATCASEKEIPKVWALYGHLDASTLERNQVGKEVKRGDILGLLGDVHENGGW